MKAISLWQPWATLVACGSKKIETRSWYTSHRGPLAIHAAKKGDRYSLESFASDSGLVSSLWKTGFPSGLTAREGVGWLLRSLPFGALVAVVEVTDCIRTELLDLEEVEIDSPRYPRGNIDRAPWCERDMGDFSPGRYAWVFKFVRVLNTPLPYRGAQGLFEIPHAALAENPETRS